ncbi:hypothetical protein, partial [Limosilactobacillus reuteri]|uniref:hypothetical protein n=1 Tax=Limosilactobacillus reuteri TaxID=1598 RepID=UPI001CDA626C
LGIGDIEFFIYNLSDMGMVSNSFNYPMEFFNHAISLFIYKEKQTTIHPSPSLHYYPVSFYSRLLKIKDQSKPQSFAIFN